MSVLEGRLSKGEAVVCPSEGLVEDCTNGGQLSGNEGGAPKGDTEGWSLVAGGGRSAGKEGGPPNRELVKEAADFSATGLSKDGVRGGKTGFGAGGASISGLGGLGHWAISWFCSSAVGDFEAIELPTGAS